MKPVKIRSIFFKIFPPLAAQDLEEMMQLMRMYPTRNDVLWILYAILMSAAYTTRTFAITWLSSPVTHLLGVYPEQLTQVIIRTAVGLGLGQLVCIFLRLWIVTSNLRKGHRVEYHQLVQRLPPEDRRSSLRAAKVNYVLIYLSCYLFLLSDQVYMLLQWQSLVQIMSHITWLAIHLLWTRIIAVDLIVMYVVAFAAYSQVQADCDDLLSVIDIPLISDEAYESKLSHAYSRVMKSLAQFKDLARYIKFSGDLMIIPTVASIIHTLGATSSSNYDRFKKVLVAGAGIYCSSGIYIVPVIWSGVERRASEMYGLLNSAICHGASAHETLDSFRRRVSLQRKIVEDIACSRTHLAVAEYDEEQKITSMDVLANLLATFEFLMLILDFIDLID